MCTRPKAPARCMRAIARSHGQAWAALTPLQMHSHVTAVSTVTDVCGGRCIYFTCLIEMRKGGGNLRGNMGSTCQRAMVPACTSWLWPDICSAGFRGVDQSQSPRLAGTTWLVYTSPCKQFCLQETASNSRIQNTRVKFGIGLVSWMSCRPSPACAMTGRRCEPK